VTAITPRSSEGDRLHGVCQTRLKRAADMTPSWRPLQIGTIILHWPWGRQCPVLSVRGRQCNGANSSLFLAVRLKMVIDLHCGEVTTETREGEGSTSVVRLPCSPPMRNDDFSPAFSRSASNKLARDRATDVL